MRDNGSTLSIGTGPRDMRDATKGTALVLGATGGIGRPIAKLLGEWGWLVRALHRDPRTISGPEPIEWVEGDALVPRDVARSARGVDVIIHAVKPKQYRDWHTLVLPMIDNSIAAAQGARIVLPGNVYNMAETLDRRSTRTHRRTHTSWHSDMSWPKRLLFGQDRTKHDRLPPLVGSPTGGQEGAPSPLLPSFTEPGDGRRAHPCVRA